jgi:ribosomal protein S18 acetylase RimI-like enzyme
VQLRPLAAPVAEPLASALTRFDCGNEAINQYLAEQAETAVHEGLVTVLLLLDDHHDEPVVAGYVSLGLSQILLTNSEKGDFRDLRMAIGAIRVGMLGVSLEYQHQDHGKRMLFAVVGLARDVGSLVAARFLVADANDHALGWYLSLGWALNESDQERSRLEGRGFTSIRFDLGRPTQSGA